MRWPYKLFPTSHPAVALGGRWVRPRPVLLVSVIGPAGTQVREAVLDTAADDTVFPEAMAARIGIDLSQAPSGVASAVGLAAVPVRYSEVTLRVTDGQERRQWQAWVGFTPARLNRALLGFAGFLQFFRAVFDGDREEVELTINGLYPGA
jgi:hypothetical protein